MNCPLCAHKDIAPLITTCPSCGADLVPFTLLEDMEEQYSETLKRKISLEGELLQQRQESEIALGKSRRTQYQLLFLLFLLPLFHWICAKEPAPVVQKVMVAPDSLVWYRDRYVQTRIQEADTLFYVVQEGDVLEHLGELFYNNHMAAEQIGIDNGMLTFTSRQHLTPGDTLIIRLLRH